MILYDKNIGKMLDRDMAYAPVASEQDKFRLL